MSILVKFRPFFGHFCNFEDIQNCEKDFFPPNSFCIGPQKSYTISLAQKKYPKKFFYGLPLRNPKILAIFGPFLANFVTLRIYRTVKKIFFHLILFALDHKNSILIQNNFFNYQKSFLARFLAPFAKNMDFCDFCHFTVTLRPYENYKSSKFWPNFFFVNFYVYLQFI